MCIPQKVAERFPFSLAPLTRSNEMEEFARQRSQNNAQRDLLFHWRCLLPESILALPTSPAPCRVALDSPQGTGMVKYINPLFVGRHITCGLGIVLLVACCGGSPPFRWGAAQYRSKRQRVRGIGGVLAPVSESTTLNKLFYSASEQS